MMTLFCVSDPKTDDPNRGFNQPLKKVEKKPVTPFTGKPAPKYTPVGNGVYKDNDTGKMETIIPENNRANYLREYAAKVILENTSIPIAEIQVKGGGKIAIYKGKRPRFIKSYFQELVDAKAAELRANIEYGALSITNELMLFF